MANEPITLQEAIQYFTDPDNCLSYLVVRRWPNGVICPTCGRNDVSFVPSRRIWQCKNRHDRSQFSIKIGTIFEDSPLGLDKWLTAMWMIGNCKNGISSYEIHRGIGVTQKTAWFMLHRIRLAMQDGTPAKLSGEIEADESFIGGAARNMHADVKARKIFGRGGAGKAIVAAVLERGGKVRAKVVTRRRKAQLQELVRENVECGSTVYTDELKSYEGIADDYTHCVINHALEYVNGSVHTNGMENFWSCLKRGLNGTYISVEPYHLFRYVDEQAFRFNNRKDMTDADRFDLVVRQIIGRRLTYKTLIGKTEDHLHVN